MKTLVASSSAAALVVVCACSSPSAGPAAPASGASLFNGNCSACHQADGRGIPGVYPSLSRSAVVDGPPADLARWVIQGRRPAAMPAGRYPTVMPAFGWLRPAAAAALFTYIRSNFGNDAPAVAEAEISRSLGQ